MPPQILIIDDDKLLCTILKITLTQAGFAVKMAHNGLAGLQKFQEIEPDLVLLDVMMPGLDGWETCRRIRKTTDTPIIMLTILGSEADIAKGLELGANEYLVKPTPPEELIANIENVLGETSFSRKNGNDLPRAEFRWLALGT